ncbi:MAG TPA: hypothetical protein VF679_06650, partial [Pedobacter sp.]
FAFSKRAIKFYVKFFTVRFFRSTLRDISVPRLDNSPYSLVTEGNIFTCGILRRAKIIFLALTLEFWKHETCFTKLLMVGNLG